MESYIQGLPRDQPLFGLRTNHGFKMLKRDLKLVGIPYIDEAGLVFDFHALRCQYATLLDAAGVTPRVVQALMRVSSDALVSRYTRPRVADQVTASMSIPDLGITKPTKQSMKATGTNGKPVAHQLPTDESRATGQDRNGILSMHNNSTIGDHAVSTANSVVSLDLQGNPSNSISISPANMEESLRIASPKRNRRNDLRPIGLQQEPVGDSPQLPTEFLEDNSDLARLVRAWPSLSVVQRNRIMNVVG